MAKKQKTNKEHKIKQELAVQKMRNLKKKQIRLLIVGVVILAMAIGLLLQNERSTASFIGLGVALLGGALMVFDYYKDTKG